MVVFIKLLMIYLTAVVSVTNQVYATSKHLIKKTPFWNVW